MSLDMDKPFDRWQANHEAAKEAAALRALQLAEEPVIGHGGELVPQGKDAWKHPGSHCAVQYPTTTSAGASLERLSLASDAQCFDAAIDAAHAIGAHDSIERMLAHHMASAHTLSMKMIGRATKLMQESENFDTLSGQGKRYEQCARLAALGARLMDTYQRGMLTLSRCRGGGQQTVTVVHQHVNVATGGQAAVAGAVQGSSE
jgi:hypothetical protein